MSKDYGDQFVESVNFSLPQSIRDSREVEAHNARCAEFVARVSPFHEATPFNAIVERPACAKDEPVSEREKWQGIRENVLCVRAEDYGRLLSAYRRQLGCHDFSKVCPECARHGHTGIPAVKDRHSEELDAGDCDVCGGYGE
jgi:hypothetical protein